MQPICEVPAEGPRQFGFPRIDRVKIEAAHQGMAGFDDSFIPPDPKPIIGRD